MTECLNTFVVFFLSFNLINTATCLPQFQMSLTDLCFHYLIKKAGEQPSPDSNILVFPAMITPTR